MDETKKEKFLPASRDIVFKNLFGVQENIEFVTDMLERLLDLEPLALKGAVVTNSVKLDKETVENKSFEMDVFVRLSNGEQINLEMQTTYDKNAEKKNTMYVTGMIHNSLKVGDNYKDAKKVSGITFAKNMEIKEHKKKKAIQRYFWTNEHDINDKILPELYSIMLVNLEYNCECLEEMPSRFIGWMKFLSAKTEEEMYEASKKEPILMKAYKECKRFMNLEYVQNFEADEKLRRSRELSHIEEAEQKGILEGITQGISQGRKEEKHEIVKNLLKTDISLEIISSSTGLSIEELNKIKEKL